MLLLLIRGITLFSPGTEVCAQVSTPDTLFLCEAGPLLFSENFDPESVSERWFYRGEFALRDGALSRTQINAENIERVFLKDPGFHNAIIQFDFKFEGATTDLRLVTGSGGHYNSIIQIRPGHFQVNTPVDRKAKLVPSHIGECKFTVEKGKWYTMTVEYFDREVVAYLDAEHFITGSHPIIDRTREYFAFQFDRPSAAIDNIRIWEAKGRRSNWPGRQKQLSLIQSYRPPVERNPENLYRYQFTNVQSRLHRFDSNYQQLKLHHGNLQGSLHSDYPEAFKSHKELAKSISEAKRKLKAGDPQFKSMESELHRTRREEEKYVVSRFPQLKDLPKHRYLSEVELARAKLEKANDLKLVSLVRDTAARQEALEIKFPGAFVPVDSLVDRRNAIRKGLDVDPEFKRRNREVADAWQAIKQYELQAEPRLAEWEAARKSFLEGH